jgi:hypothetical protein
VSPVLSLSSRSAPFIVPEELFQHRIFPVLPVVITGIIILYQDAFSVAETIVVVPAGFTCFIFHSLPPDYK